MPAVAALIIIEQLGVYVLWGTELRTIQASLLLPQQFMTRVVQYSAVLKQQHQVLSRAC
jgi:hypothetical protein